MQSLDLLEIQDQWNRINLTNKTNETAIICEAFENW